jgi:TRAP-type mannitol/chloroaromatic compound transport system permease small subunit
MKEAEDASRIQHIVGSIIAFFILGVIVMAFWNWTMPVVFALSQIGYLDALMMMAIGRVCTR